MRKGDGQRNENNGDTQNSVQSGQHTGPVVIMHGDHNNVVTGDNHGGINQKFGAK